MPVALFAGTITLPVASMVTPVKPPFVNNVGIAVVDVAVILSTLSFVKTLPAVPPVIPFTSVAE